VSQRLGKGNSRAAHFSEFRRRKFKWNKCLRGYEKKTEEEHISQRLGEGNSSGTNVLEAMGRKLKRSTYLRG